MLTFDKRFGWSRLLDFHSLWLFFRTCLCLQPFTSTAFTSICCVFTVSGFWHCSTCWTSSSAKSSIRWCDWGTQFSTNKTTRQTILLHSALQWAPLSSLSSLSFFQQVSHNYQNYKLTLIIKSRSFLPVFDNLLGRVLALPLDTTMCPFFLALFSDFLFSTVSCGRNS